MDGRHDHDGWVAATRPQNGRWAPRWHPVALHRPLPLFDPDGPHGRCICRDSQRAADLRVGQRARRRPESRKLRGPLRPDQILAPVAKGNRACATMSECEQKFERADRHEACAAKSTSWGNLIISPDQRVLHRHRLPGGRAYLRGLGQPEITDLDSRHGTRRRLLSGRPKPASRRERRTSRTNGAHRHRARDAGPTSSSKF